MAIEEDYNNLVTAAQRWYKNLTNAKDPQHPFNVVGCSLDAHQVKILQASLPQSICFNTLKSHWDLAQPYPQRLQQPFLIVACNVFHYSQQPELWLDNCFRSCVELWIQDLVWRPRGHNKELGSDGDKTRYGLGKRVYQFADSDARYLDLNNYKGRLLDYWVYDAGSLRANRTMVNFMARFRGDL